MKPFTCFFSQFEVQIEILGYTAAAIALVVSLTVGRLALNYWDKRKYLRELNFELRKNFHNLYGEFRTNVRLWKLAGSPKNVEEGQEILKLAIKTEGKLEALLSDIASLKTLSPEETCILGLYRQAFQTVRETIQSRSDRSIPCDQDEDDYHFFNEATAAVSRIVVDRRKEPTELQSRRNLDQVLEIRWDQWLLGVKTYGRKQEWRNAIDTVADHRIAKRDSEPKQ